MNKPFKIKKLFDNNISILSFSIGGYYVLFGVFALLMVRLQAMMLPDFITLSDDSFVDNLRVLHEIWIVYMPFLILLGTAYVLFGLFYKMIKKISFYINLALGILSLIWVIVYMINSVKYIDVFFANTEIEFDAIKNFGYVMSGFGFLAILATFTVPQYIIGRKIRKQEIENNNIQHE